MGIGAFVFSLPHFLSEKVATVSNETENPMICLNETRTNSPSTDTSSMSDQAFFIFIIGQILHGIGAAPILSLGNLEKFTQQCCLILFHAHYSLF